MQLKKKVAEEKAWLVQLKESCESLRIKTDQIIQYFQSHVWCVDTYSPVTSIRNLVGKRWLSDDVIDTVFDISMMIHSVLCVSQHTLCTHPLGYMRKCAPYKKMVSMFQKLLWP